MKNSQVMVIGSGRFGTAAAQKLASSARLTVVDLDGARLLQLAKEGIHTVCAEGISFLVKSNLQEYDCIVPAIPRHVAFEWLVCNGGIKKANLKLPESVFLPNMFLGPPGTYYTSLSSRLCPENCPEPEGYCFLTGEERPRPLYSLLEELPVPVFVIRSRQLADGVGGIAPRDLYEAKKWVEEMEGGGFIATSCRCHAVLDAFEVN